MMYGEYFDFDNDKPLTSEANKVQSQLANGEVTAMTVLRGLQLAAVVNARGRRRSPSSILHKLLQKKRKTAHTVCEHLSEASQHVVDHAHDFTVAMNNTIDMVTPRNRSTKGVSDELAAQLEYTHESLFDLWTTTSDMLAGFRVTMERVFGLKATRLNIMLANGMARSQLLQAYGKDLKDTGEDDDLEEDE